MQQERIAQLDEAVSEVFSLMLGRECQPGPCCPAVHSEGTGKSRTPAASGKAISALIHFSGTMRGTCTIHLALRTATALTGDLLGPFPLAETRALTADTAGELCNMIAGSWKSRQPDIHASCTLSSPLVTTTDLLATTSSNLASPPAFRNTLIRAYKFQEHCLRLELGFD